MRTVLLITLCFFIQACIKEPADMLLNCGLGENQLGNFVVVPAGKLVGGRVDDSTSDILNTLQEIPSFLMQVNEVTNLEFGRFVSETGYLTDAEQIANSARVDAGSAIFVSPTMKPGDGAANKKESAEVGWILSKEATWRSPEGVDSSIEGKALNPVVHVSLNDARAYAEWADARLPSELEWQHAASLGLFDQEDEASGAYTVDGVPRANTWQGVFPLFNTNEDGFREHAPVGCFDENEVGVYDMIGNVWEWTETPIDSRSFVIKGGSFLCADNFCRRYRPTARESQESDFSTNHIGIRLVKDLERSYSSKGF